MSELGVFEYIGTAAVKRLRQNKLSAGKPFMINSDDLPSGQSYLEYPDGIICIVKVSTNSRAFTIMAELDADQPKAFRTCLGIA